MKKTIFVLAALAVVIAALAGGAAFLLRQKHLQELSRIASQAEDKLKSKSYDQAIAMLRKVEADGGTDRSTYLMGRAFAEQGKTEQAENYYNRLLKDYPKSSFMPDTRLELARFRFAEKDYKGAQDQLLQILAKSPKSTAADFALVMLAKISLQNRDEAQARRNLEIVLRKKDSPAKSDAEFVIGDLNMKRLKSPDPGPGDETYTIKPGDTLSKMERKLKVPADLLMGINDLSPLTLRVGRTIRVPHLDISLVIDKTRRTLSILNNGEFLKKYHVGLNQNDKLLPAGDYSVTKKYPKGLAYIKDDSSEEIKAGAPNNPYGTRFIELRRGVGIHGTNDPEKVGGLVSNGSIVMSNHDVEELYALVKTKTPVTVKGSVSGDAGQGK